MNDFYQWLYDHYASPRFNEEALSLAYQRQKAEWLEFSKTLPNHERLLSFDLLNSMKNVWGAQCFAYGVQAGLSLALDIPPDGFISPEAL